MYGFEFSKCAVRCAGARLGAGSGGCVLWERLLWIKCNLLSASVHVHVAAGREARAKFSFYTVQQAVFSFTGSQILYHICSHWRFIRGCCDARVPHSHNRFPPTDVRSPREATAQPSQHSKGSGGDCSTRAASAAARSERRPRMQRHRQSQAGPMVLSRREALGERPHLQRQAHSRHLYAPAWFRRPHRPGRPRRRCRSWLRSFHNHNPPHHNQQNQITFSLFLVDRNFRAVCVLMISLILKFSKVHVPDELRTKLDRTRVLYGTCLLGGKWTPHDRNAQTHFAVSLHSCPPHTRTTMSHLQLGALAPSQGLSLSQTVLLHRLAPESHLPRQRPRPGLAARLE